MGSAKRASANGVGQKEIVIRFSANQANNSAGRTRADSGAARSWAPAAKWGQISHTEASKAGPANIEARSLGVTW